MYQIRNSDLFKENVLFVYISILRKYFIKITFSKCNKKYVRITFNVL